MDEVNDFGRTNRSRLRPHVVRSEWIAWPVQTGGMTVTSFESTNFDSLEKSLPVRRDFLPELLQRLLFSDIDH